MAWVHVKGNALDGTALTGGITAFEEDDHAPVVSFKLFLQFDQLSFVGFQLFPLAVALERLAAFPLQLGVFQFELLDAFFQRW